MEDIRLGQAYLVNALGTSDGTQDKCYKDGFWYKTDAVGGEGEREEVVSSLLSVSTLPTVAYVTYRSIKINGSPGCVSRSFTGHGETFVSVQRLFSNVRGGDLTRILAEADADDAVRYVADFVKSAAGVDILTYLADTILLDQLILNTDRHLHNLGVVYIHRTDSFRIAPIFDNGRSFFCGDKRYDSSLSIGDNIRHLTFRPFSASMDLMVDILAPYSRLRIRRADLRRTIFSLPMGLVRQTLEYQLQRKDIAVLA